MLKQQELRERSPILSQDPDPPHECFIESSNLKNKRTNTDTELP